MSTHTCEWGYPELCGAVATWICYPDKFPGSIYACDRHAPSMVSAELAHRLPDAPPLPLPELKAYVDALAWRSVLLRDTNRLRADNAHAAFCTYRAEFLKRGGKRGETSEEAPATNVNRT